MRANVLGSVVLALFVAGCGTMINQTDPAEDKLSLADRRIPRYTIYGGVAQDVCNATNALAYAVTAADEDWETRTSDAGLALLFLVDVPLSLVTDTICLPGYVKIALYGAGTASTASNLRAGSPSSASTP